MLGEIAFLVTNLFNVVKSVSGKSIPFPFAELLFQAALLDASKNAESSGIELFCKNPFDLVWE